VTLAALLLAIAAGGFSLAWGFAQVGLPQLGRWPVIISVVWMLAIWRRWRWFAHVGLGLDILLAALGLWFLDLAPGWMFAGVTCALLAWDLVFFRQRQSFAASDEERRRMERRHLFRIAFLSLLGFVLSGVAMLVRLQFNFDWAAFMVIVCALSLMEIIRWFRTRA
jgi:hypothetical protein